MNTVTEPVLLREQGGAYDATGLTRGKPISALWVGVAAFLLFLLPPAYFLLRFGEDAPFYFMAQDSFYYLSIALHSAGVPFFSIDGLHPTNGFHPLWEWLLFLASKSSFFRLTGPSVLQRLFGADLAIVSLAVALLSVYAYKLTGRFWVAVLAVCPGLFWMLSGVGAPAYLNNWSYVNGMETGVELFCFTVTILLLGREFRWGVRYLVGTIFLGFTVLARLDDVFFLLAIAAGAAISSPRGERVRRLAPFAIPVLMIAAYLLYNHRTLGVWMPVSGMAKAGKGYRATVGETLRLLRGTPFWAMQPNQVGFYFGNTYVMVAQMLGPLSIASAFLWWARRRPEVSPVLRWLGAGTVFKCSYNAVMVPLGYQGAWYYGAPIAVTNLMLAVVLCYALSGLRRDDSGPSSPASPGWQRWLYAGGQGAGLLVLAFLAFNVVASRASQNGFDVTKRTWEERDQIAAALRATGHPLFLEFQDGELSFATRLPGLSAFGLAADPEAARAKQQGRYFDLLARRGVTVAAASGTYPGMLAAAGGNPAVFKVWGFDPEEMRHYRFEPFWSDNTGDVVLYHIVRKP